jgi:hypothetical protein
VREEKQSEKNDCQFRVGCVVFGLGVLHCLGTVYHGLVARALIKRRTSPPFDSISLVYRSPKKVVNIEPDHVIEDLKDLFTVLEDC